MLDLFELHAKEDIVMDRPSQVPGITCMLICCTHARVEGALLGTMKGKTIPMTIVCKLSGLDLLNVIRFPVPVFEFALD